MSEAAVGIKLTLDGATQVEAGLQRAAKSLDGVGVSAKQTANAMRMIPMQMTDIVTGLASGQSPLTVLLQQGGQLKDSFGSVGGAMRGMASYVAGLVNPFTLAAGAVGAFAVAAYQGKQEMADMEKALLMSGNTMGMTVGQLNELAKSMSTLGGATRGEAIESLTALAASGAVARGDLEKFGRVTADLARLGIQPVKDTAKAFKELADEPAKAVLKLNEGLHFLTLAQYEHIKALEEQGRKQDAATVAQKAYSDAFQPIIDHTRANLGYLETSWRGVGTVAKWAWDKMMGLGRPDTGEDRLRAARTKLEDMQSGRHKWGFNISASERQEIIAAQQKEVTYLERVTQAMKDQAAADATRQRQQEAGIQAEQAAEKLQDKGLSRQQQLNKALQEYRDNLAAIRAANPNSERLDPRNVAAGEAAIREQFKAPKAAVDDFTRSAERGREALADLLNSQAGLNSSFNNQWNDLAAGAKKYGWSVGQLEQAQAALLAQQPFMREQVRKDEEAWKSAQKAYADVAKPLLQDAQQAEERLQKLKDETDARQLLVGADMSLAEAIERVTIKRLEERRAMMDPGNQAAFDAITREIDARKTALPLIGKKDDQKEMDELSKSLASSIEEGITSGFRSGKGVADIFITELKAQFAKTVLRPMIQPIAEAGSALMKTGIDFVLSKLKFSFAGGGYTGPGSRTGGMDGQGGFLAMLHPNETVVDHHAGQAVASGRQVVYNQTLNYSFGSGSDAAQVLTAAQLGAALARHQFRDDLARGRV